MTRYVLMTMLLAAMPLAAAPAERSLLFTKLWTHRHTNFDVTNPYDAQFLDMTAGDSWTHVCLRQSRTGDD